MAELIAGPIWSIMPGGEHQPGEPLLYRLPGDLRLPDGLRLDPARGTAPAAPAPARRTGWTPTPRAPGRGPRRSGRRCSPPRLGPEVPRTSTKRRCCSISSCSSTKGNGRQSDSISCWPVRAPLHVERLEQQVDDELLGQPQVVERSRGSGAVPPLDLARRGSRWYLDAAGHGRDLAVAGSEVGASTATARRPGDAVAPAGAGGGEGARPEARGRGGRSGASAVRRPGARAA